MENAYAHLFKVVTDSFLIFQEEQYRLKKERLKDYGLTDYYEALDALAPMATMEQVKTFIQFKGEATGSIDAELRNQVLAQQTLVAYCKEFDPIHREVAKVKAGERIDFLHFNFVRLINATLGLEDAFRETTLTMTRVGMETRYFLLLGLDYLKSVRSFGKGSAFDVFDFLALYRIGKSLVYIHRSLLKKSLARHGFDSPKGEAFLRGLFSGSLRGQLPPSRPSAGVPANSPERRFGRQNF